MKTRVKRITTAPAIIRGEKFRYNEKIHTFLEKSREGNTRALNSRGKIVIVPQKPSELWRII